MPDKYAFIFILCGNGKLTWLGLKTIISHLFIQTDILTDTLARFTLGPGATTWHHSSYIVTT